MAVFLAAGFLSVSCNGVSLTTTPMSGLVRKDFTERALLDVRGGASKKKKPRTGSLAKTVTGKKKVQAKKPSEKKSGGNNGLGDWYGQIPRLTKTYINSIVTCTVLGLLSVVPQAMQL